MSSRINTTERAARWVTTRLAAKYLDMSEDALRRMLERHARRGDDGVVYAELDGVRARRFGRRWRVAFSEAWHLAHSVLDRDGA